MGPVGVQEMIVIFLVALVLFGPKKLPELGKTIGKAITEFRRAQSELKSTFAGHMQELEKEHESIKEVTRSFTSDIQGHYDSPYWDTGAYGTESHESTTASPSTVSASAPQGAETAVSQEAVHGTVPRTNGQHDSPAAAPPPASSDASAQPSPDQHSVNSQA